MTKSANLIQRRELNPLLLKAHKIAKHYEKAAGCAASVMGPEWDSSSIQFSSPCGKCCGTAIPGGETCLLTHKNAVNEGRRLGGSYIYVCPAEFIFWTSPFFSRGRYAGAFISGGVLGTYNEATGDNFKNSYHTASSAPSTSIQGAESFIPGVSRKSSEEVKALAQMLMICADQITSGSSSVNHLKNLSRCDVSGEGVSAKGSVNKENDAYPMDMERMLLASLRRGDNRAAQKILKDLLDSLYKTVRGNFSIFRLRAMELAVLLSRAVSNPKDIEDDTVLDTNNRYLKIIEESKNLLEVTYILSIRIERMAGKIFSFQDVRHPSALRKAERFIWENYTRKLSLQEIANASGLSAPYFSTIFNSEMGENLTYYLNRLRVEKAAAMLVATDIPISGIAAACGFEDQSWFSKIFKNNTGFSPGKYREQGSIIYLQGGQP
jgi:AraC-like DNA-binding protein/ligand-binding sensor protein